MPLPLLALVILGIAALAVAAYVFLLGRRRSEIIGRAAGDPAGLSGPGGLTIALRGAQRKGVGQRLMALMPASWGEDDATKIKLIRAGYDSPTAPLVYTTIRVVSLVLVPVLVAPLVIHRHASEMLFGVAWSLLAGWGLPVWYVNRRMFSRQERLKRSIPDSLDLLVVCIEAGVSLDAAILRVAREMSRVHPELSSELMVVNRKTNAGVPRDQALRGLWERTGVDELRALVSTMIQSEKWGTSIGRVLQVYAETLRRKRRQAVEKKAATLPVKMLFPLILFILPALFAVVMGPAIIEIPKLFKMGQ